MTIGLRHAAVTGAGPGIGDAICARLLRDGWRVTGLSRGTPRFGDASFAHRAVDLGTRSCAPASFCAA